MPSRYIPTFPKYIYLRKSTKTGGYGSVWWISYVPAKNQRRHCPLHLAPEWEYAHEVKHIGAPPTGPIYDKDEAILKRNDLLKIVDQRKTSNMVAAEPASLKRMVKWYFEYLAGPTKDAAPGTIRGYRTILPAFMAAVGSSIQISKITSHHIEQHLDRMHEKGLAPSTVDQHRKALKAFFGALVRKKRIIRSNPTEGVDPRSTINYNDHFVLTVQQIHAFQRCINSHWRRLLDYYLLTGFRKMEPTYLQWKHIDFENRIIRNPTSKTRRTSPSRTIPMIPALERLLRGLHDGQDLEQYVFLNTRGQSPSPTNVTDVMYAGARAAGIPVGRPYFTIHTFRYTVASLNPDSPTILSMFMGWSNVQRGFEYTSFVPEAVERFAQRHADRIFNQEEEGGRPLDL